MANRDMKKMLNITNHQGNANQNHNEISPHNVRMVIIKTATKTITTKITSVGEDVEKKNPSFTVSGNVNWCSHYGKQCGGSSKN